MSPSYLRTRDIPVTGGPISGNKGWGKQIPQSTAMGTEDVKQPLWAWNPLLFITKALGYSLLGRHSTVAFLNIHPSPRCICPVIFSRYSILRTWNSFYSYIYFFICEHFSLKYTWHPQTWSQMTCYLAIVVFWSNFLRDSATNIFSCYNKIRFDNAIHLALLKVNHRTTSFSCDRGLRSV